MVKVKTKSGFKCEIDERIANDYRLLTAITDAESDDVSVQIKGTTAVVKLILGTEESRLIEHIQSKNDGFVPQDVLTNEIIDIMNSISTLKNSQSSQG